MTRAARGLLALLVAAHLALAAALPLSGDEAYHWVWAMHPAWGYHEHPPLQAWLIRAAVELLGHRAWAVRLPAILAGAALPPLLAAAARRVAARAGVPLATGPAFLAAAALPPLVFVLSGYANNDALCVALALAALLAADPEADGGRLVPLAPPLFALALLSKWTALFALPGLLFLLVRAPAPRRRPLRAGALAAAALLAPMIAWNARHGFPQLAIRVGHGTVRFFPLQFVLELVPPEWLALGPALFAAGFLWLARGWAAPGRLARALALTALAAIGFYHLAMFRQHVEVHWPLPGFLAALPPVWALRPRWRPWLSGSALASALAVAGLAVPLAAGRLHGTGYRLRPQLSDGRRIAAQLAGWPQFAARLRAEAARLPPGGFILGDGYGLLSQSLFFLEGRRAGCLIELPARSGGSFGYFEAAAPPPAGADALFVDDLSGRDAPETLRKVALLFATVRALPPFTACRAAACRTVSFYRLSGFRGIAARRAYYRPREVARAAGFLAAQPEAARRPEPRP